jgi:hypothetical protein
MASPLAALFKASSCRPGFPNKASGGKPMNNVDLPNQIFLRRQSLVEPEAYRATIQIPQ